MTKKPSYEELEYKVEKLEKEIVECKQGQEALRHNHEMHQIVVGNVDVALTIIGTDYKIIWVNNTISKWFGKDLSEFVGKHCYKEFEQKNSVCHYCSAVKAIATGQPNEAETQGIKPDGTPFTVRDKVYPIIKDGEVIAFNEIVEDITARKLAEEEREKLIKELQEALKEIKTLRGILPICSFCKKIRDDKGYWEQVDVYIHKYSQADISHGICPACAKEHYPDLEPFDG